MIQHLHKNARTTASIRQEIQASTQSTSSLARMYGLSWITVKKWRQRCSVEDASSRPHHIHSSLSQEEEDLILFERKEYKKSIEEIFLCLTDHIPHLHPVKVYRLLKRYNLSVLPDELRRAERQIRRFRKYGIGYIHIDLLYAPKINGKRRYIFTAIDRVSKLAFVSIKERKTKQMGAQLLQEVLSFYPYPLRYILTDNGLEFCYNALPKRKKTKKIHPFTALCIQHKIQHRTIKFKHPWTNGMVERFNGKIKDNVIRRYLFSSVDDLRLHLTEYINRYNFDIKLRQLNYLTPAEYLKRTKNISIQRVVS